jgi:hypothetical protein
VGGQRILYGIDRLPATLSPDDPRLPAISVDASPLRLNSLPLPLDAWGDGADGHAARVTATHAWLLAACGDYNGALRRDVARYLDLVAGHIEDHRDELTAGLARFHGLYQPEDWFWSALRPLPRAWWWRDGEPAHADLSFWDGDAVIAIRPDDFATDDLPTALQYFWRDETLPVSPFRREFSVTPSSP